jgi:small subunit ribosomal protein S16e
VQGKGLIRVNGKPLKLFAPEILRAKLYEPILILGTDKFAEVDIRVRVAGGGHTSQVYATRQAVRFRETWKSYGENVMLTTTSNRLPRPLSVPESAPLRAAEKTNH